jgi:hypothetical protein
VGGGSAPATKVPVNGNADINAHVNGNGHLNGNGDGRASRDFVHAALRARSAQGDDAATLPQSTTSSETERS